MPVKIEPSWHHQLASEFDKSYFKNLIEFVKSEYKNHTCYPQPSRLFTAFEHTPFQDVQVVIIGQDPYHGPGQANGLCFSVADGVATPPSLQNMYKEIKDDLGIDIPKSGNLERWANQGVLLLNATLSVRAHEAGSHQKKGWELFTDAVIAKISEEREGIIFLLWGGYAKKKGAKIDTTKHLVLTSGHPSPLSANRGYWFGNKHFSKTNNYLLQNKRNTINW
ncbi:MAG: uracil-DNA glycosylase [Flavobacteriaceae bacterium]|nr:uracil-DNA glycosylase [Flavobacteriaceae bacterium]